MSVNSSTSIFLVCYLMLFSIQSFILLKTPFISLKNTIRINLEISKLFALREPFFEGAASSDCTATDLNQADLLSQEREESEKFTTCVCVPLCLLICLPLMLSEALCWPLTKTASCYVSLSCRHSCVCYTHRLFTHILSTYMIIQSINYVIRG